ncbi:MAG: FKBP-type peptidyl-prolyl cis-trans isomerase [Saprospiraceae bacterium]
MKNFFPYVLILLLFACNSTSDKTPSITTEPELTEAEADDLLLQMATHLIAEPSNQKEEQNNTIVNHAIDNNFAMQPTRTGLYVQILEEGTGEKIKWGDYISAHYRGQFLDGKVFDSSYAKKKPLQFYVGNTIDGWNEGLQMAKVGTKMRLLIPSALAYGEAGIKINDIRYLVPPNAILQFELEILEKLVGPK